MTIALNGIDKLTLANSSFVQVDQNGFADFNTLADALVWVAGQVPTAASPWAIYLAPGVYAESNLTMIDYCDIIGLGAPEDVIISANDAANGIIESAVTCTISNISITNQNAGGPAIAVTANILTVRNCVINGTGAGDAITMVAGTLNSYDTTIGAGDINLSTAICTLSMYRCRVTTDPIDTAGAFAHVLTFEKCDFGGQNLVSAATGVATLSMTGCSDVGTVSNAGSGAFTIDDSSIDTVTASSTGTFVILGGSIRACGGATASITWKTMAQQYEVIAGMSVQQAITAAAADAPAPSATAPYTVLIHPGIYDEVITCATWVNLKGIGPKGAVVIYQTNANVLTLATYVQLQNFTLRVVTPDAGRRIILDNGVACIARMTDLIFEITTPAAHAHRFILLTGAGNYIIERCSYNIGGTGVSYGILNSTNPATIFLIDNDFIFININAFFIRMDIAAADWYSKGNRWTGTCKMFDNDAGTWYGDNDAMICTGAWLNTGTTMILRDCTIEAPVVAGTLATVRMKNCSYRAIQRTGTGNIVDESPDLKDAPWHIERWTWQAALANAQVGVRGVPLDAGSGQVVIETLDSGAGIMAVETNPELARALGNEFTPARTPRFLTQISAHTDNASGAGNPAFDPHVTMFYGLRETLGNALPAATEHHAGFIWTGAAFNASSDDGVATQTTALATPSDDAQHQLEVIVFGGVTTVGWVEFYVDGVLVATHSTRIPTAVLDWQHLIIGLTTGGGDTISVTIRNGGTAECPA